MEKSDVFDYEKFKESSFKSIDYPETYNARAFCDVLLKLLDELHVVAVHLVGSSLGGFLAQKFYELSGKPSACVKSLILCNTFIDTYSFESRFSFWMLPVSMLRMTFEYPSVPTDADEYIKTSVDLAKQQTFKMSQSELASRLTMACTTDKVAVEKLRDADITIVEVSFETLASSHFCSIQLKTDLFIRQESVTYKEQDAVVILGTHLDTVPRQATIGFLVVLHEGTENRKRFMLKEVVKQGSVGLLFIPNTVAPVIRYRIMVCPFTPVQVGDLDTTYKRLYEGVHRAYPEAKVASIDTGGHFPFLSRHDEFAAYMRMHFEPYMNTPFFPAFLEDGNY
ncbi:unnamed protein product [Hydatigera taeniaeformis]|uniref:Maspardin n=1 Tax=Hydatigena taeniaeformis TaxID=6205 RepID=A0A158RDE3_HYDTA|nr:unnamed protein product [Hydatigera taeniaeformis]